MATSQCEKCSLCGCDRGPGFADMANDPPSKFRCPCVCHPVNVDALNRYLLERIYARRVFVDQPKYLFLNTPDV